MLAPLPHQDVWLVYYAIKVRPCSLPNRGMASQHNEDKIAATVGGSRKIATRSNSTYEKQENLYVGRVVTRRRPYNIKTTPIRWSVCGVFRIWALWASWPWPLTSQLGNGSTRNACRLKQYMHKQYISTFHSFISLVQGSTGQTYNWAKRYRTGVA